MMLTRRDMLSRMTAGFGMVGLAGMMKPAALSGAEMSNPALTGRLNHPAKAKRVIFLFMNGGPSQFDTFDPKPALKKHEGEAPQGKLYKENKGTGFMPSPFAFSRHGQSGLEVSESLPHLAKVIDECCLIRSMRTDVPNHEPALLQMHTGNIQPIRQAFH